MDQLVYEFYGLTNKEPHIFQQAMAR